VQINQLSDVGTQEISVFLLTLLIIDDPFYYSNKKGLKANPIGEFFKIFSPNPQLCSTTFYHPSRSFCQPWEKATQCQENQDTGGIFGRDE
jgi:hypothetical protein